MNVLMKKQLSRWALAFSALTVGSALTAHADIIVITGVNNQGTDNVLLNPATNVTTVTGTVGSVSVEWSPRFLNLRHTRS
jgi:hypothetical protein